MDVYPAHRVADVVLRDGSTARVRPVTREDEPAILSLLERVSRDSIVMRFHGAHRPDANDARRSVDVDYVDSFGLVAETAGDGTSRIVALANYYVTGESHAEIGLLVDDPLQGKGIGSLMIEHLSEAAADADITTFEAEVLADNAKMLDVIRDIRLPQDQQAALGVIHIEFPTSPTPEALEAFDRREAVAAANAVRHFLQPSSVAVIGASRRRGTIAGEVFRSLLYSGFEGPVYPVNPKAVVVQSVQAYPDVREIPGPVELAVIVVPADTVLDVAEACGTKGVRALLIISSGFSEVGDDGRARQDALVRLCRRYGMRIIGPNCMGIMNTDPDISLNATFAPTFPEPGRLAFSSQSGALGIAVIDRATELGLGMSSFVSVGNKADISGNDLLQYWEQDEDTDVILLYLESFGNPRKFARIARRVAEQKPIVAVKSGRSTSGARAAASHTGSFAAGDVAVEALFEQAGVIRTDTLEELFDVASLLANQARPKGNRVAILTNAGGLGILAADACEAAGLEVPELSIEIVRRLREELPAEASVGNPVDMIASATAEQYATCLRLIGEDGGIDSVIVIFIPPLVTKAADVARALSRASDEIDKTLLACFMGVHGVHDQLRDGDRGIPSYAFPEAAARALGKVSAHAVWIGRDKGVVPRFDDVDEGAAVRDVANLLKEGKGWLEADDVARLLKHYRIPMARTELVRSAVDAGAMAEEIGFPVALKIDSEQLTHKTDVGGVILGLTSRDEVERQAQSLADRVAQRGADLRGFIVQEMVPKAGTEMFLGVTHDPSFGPIVACGAGGTLVELMRDVRVRITPLTDVDARDMIRGLRTYPLLEGYRGSPRLDIEALEETLLRVAALVEALPQIIDLDLNPVMVFPSGSGCLVADARIRIAPAAPPPPRGARPTVA